MKIQMPHLAIQLIIIGLVISAPCMAQSEQWQSQKSRIEEQPLLIHETRGNWYLKQKYYKEARSLYEQISTEQTTIETTEKQFHTTVEQHQTDLAKFYKTIGFTQSEADAAITHVDTRMKQLQERPTALTENERKLVIDTEATQKALASLKKEFNTIDSLTDAMAKTMQTMEGKIQEAHNLKKRSWEMVQAIASEINDRRAEQMKLEVETNLKNIQQINGYLSGNLFPFLQTKIQENDTHLETIKTKAKEVQAHGATIESLAHPKEPAAVQEKKVEQKPVAPPAPIQPKEGFFMRAWHGFIDGAKSIGSWFMSFFGSAPSAQKPAKPLPKQTAKH